MDQMSRFHQYVEPVPFSGCWIWMAQIDKFGYGRFTDKEGRTRGAHAVAYEMIKGPIPPGLLIDHLCRNRACVNPDHLEAVSNRTNLLRGNTFSGINARKKVCIRGHEFTSENTGLTAKGQRYCRVCNAIRSEDYRRRHGL